MSKRKLDDSATAAIVETKINDKRQRVTTACDSSKIKPSKFRVQPVHHDMTLTHPDNIANVQAIDRNILMAQEYIKRARQQQSRLAIQSNRDKAISTKEKTNAILEKERLDDESDSGQQLDKKKNLERRIAARVKTIRGRQIKLGQKFQNNMATRLLKGKNLDFWTLTNAQQIRVTLSFIKSLYSNLAFNRIPNLAFIYKNVPDETISAKSSILPVALADTMPPLARQATIVDGFTVDISVRPQQSHSARQDAKSLLHPDPPQDDQKSQDDQNRPTGFTFDDDDQVDESTVLNYNSHSLSDDAFGHWRYLVEHSITDSEIQAQYVALAGYYCHNIHHLFKFRKLSDDDKELSEKNVQKHLDKFVKLLWLNLYRALDDNYDEEINKLESKIREALLHAKPRVSKKKKTKRELDDVDDVDGDDDDTDAKQDIVNKKDALQTIASKQNIAAKKKQVALNLQQHAKKQIEQEQIAFFERFNKLVMATERQNFNSDDDTREMRLWRGRYNTMFGDPVRATQTLVERGCAWMTTWSEFPLPL